MFCERLRFVALQNKQYEMHPYWLTVLKQCIHHPYIHKAAMREVHHLANTYTHSTRIAPELWRRRYCNFHLYSAFGLSAASANELSSQGNPVWKDNPFLIMWTDTFRNEMAQGCPCHLLLLLHTHIHRHIWQHPILSLSTVFQINGQYFTQRICAHHAW